MGTKYTTTTISGYNSSPPADDGSQVAANAVKWSTIKTKLPDPLKTAFESADTKLVTALDFGSRQVTSNDTTTAADHAKTIEIAPSVTTAVTVSLGDAATMAAGYIVSVKNSSAIAQTVGRATAGDKIDNAASNVTLAPKESRTFKVANTASEGYLTIDSYGPFIDPLLISTAPAVSDTVPVYDASDTAHRKMALSDFMKIVGSLVAETAPADSDTVALFDQTTSTTRQAQLRDIFSQIQATKINGAHLTLSTEQNPTNSSVTSVDFTSIPSWVKRISIQPIGVSTNGTSNVMVQIGDSGGIETSGYSGAATGLTNGGAVGVSNLTSGFEINMGSAASARHGIIVLELEDSATNTWVCSGAIGSSSATNFAIVAGSKALSATLDRVRITTVVGTDQFDNNSAFNIMYE